jgi:hypothetical protein
MVVVVDDKNGRTDPRKVLLHPYLFQFPINSSFALQQVVESHVPASKLDISPALTEYMAPRSLLYGGKQDTRRKMRDDVRSGLTSPFPLPSLFT